MDCIIMNEVLLMILLATMTMMITGVAMSFVKFASLDVHVLFTTIACSRVCIVPIWVALRTLQLLDVHACVPLYWMYHEHARQY